MTQARQLVLETEQRLEKFFIFDETADNCKYNHQFALRIQKEIYVEIYNYMNTDIREKLYILIEY